MADETPPLQPKSFLNIHQPVLSTHLYQVHQPTEAHRQQVHWQQQQQMWSQQLQQQQHPIVSHQNVQEIWQDTSPRFSQVWHPAHQQATSTIPIASHHQLITTPAQAVTVDQTHTRNQFFEQHQEGHGQLHVGIPGQGDLTREQHPGQLTRDTQPIGRTSPNMQFYQPQQTNHHQRLEYWQQQQQQFPEQPQHHSPNPEQRLHSPALQTTKTPESNTSSHLMWQNPQIHEQRQQSPIAHHQTASAAPVNVEHRQPSQEVPASVPSTQSVLVPHPGWQQLTPTNIPQLQLLQQQMHQGQGQQQNQQELMQQQLMFIQLQQMYHQQVLAAQLAAQQLQQQQQQQQSQAAQERTEDKPIPQHQPLFGQPNKPSIGASFSDNKPPVSVNFPDNKPSVSVSFSDSKPSVSSSFPDTKPPVSVSFSDIRSDSNTNKPDRHIQRNVDSNQFSLNNPQHSSDLFKQHRTVADSVPKAHVLPMKSEPRVTEVANVQQPSADAAGNLKSEPPATSTPEKIQKPSAKQQQVQQDPLKPYESVFLKREQQFQAQRQQRAAQLPFHKPQSAPVSALYQRPLDRNDNRSNFPNQQPAQQGSWKAAFSRPLTQPSLLGGPKPGLPSNNRPDFKQVLQDRSQKKVPDTPNIPVSQQITAQKQNTSNTGPLPLPQRLPRQSKQVMSKDNKENKEKAAWYNPYSASSQPDSSETKQKPGAVKSDVSGKSKASASKASISKTEQKATSKASETAEQSGIRALKGRLPGSYPGEGLEPSAPSASLIFGRHDKPQGPHPSRGIEPSAPSESLVFGRNIRSQGSVNLSGPIFNPHPNEMPYYKEPSYPGSYPYPDGQRPNSEPLLKRALSEETGDQSRRNKKMAGDGRCRLLVKGLNPITSKESLKNYFEVMSKEDVDDQIIFNTERTEGLITMGRKPDLNQLRKVIKDKKLEDRCLSIFEIPKIRSVIVSCDKELDKTDAIMFYFERSSVGGPLASDFLNRIDDGFLVLEFEDESSVVKVCAPDKTHTVEGKVLKVSPYYSCKDGAIWDTSIHIPPVPKPFSITLEPHQIEYVKKELKLDLNASMTYGSNNITFSCTLKPTNKNYRTLAREWESRVRDQVMKYLSENIDCLERSVSSDIWNKFVEWTGRLDNKNSKVQVKKDAKKKCVKIIGSPKILKDIQQQVDEHIAELQRLVRRRSEMKRMTSIDKVKILETQGTFDEICRKFPDMQIHVKGTEVTVEGNPEDLKDAFVEIFEECDSIQQGKFKHYKLKAFVDFVNRSAIKKHIQDNLNKKQFKGRWEINSTEIVVFTADSGDSHSLCKEILNLVNEERIPIDEEQSDILDSSNWKTFTNDKKRTFRDKVDILTTETPEIVVLGVQDLKNLVKEITNWIDDRVIKEKFLKCDPFNVEFISKHWQDKDYSDIEKSGVKITVKGNGILISGTSKNIQSTELELEKRLKQICKKVQKFERTAVCDVILSAKRNGTLDEIESKSRCLVKLPVEMDGETSFSALFDREQATDEIGEAQAEGGDTAGVMTKNNRIKIQLVKGEIGQQKGDTIVCSTSTKLNLNSGAAHSLIKHGGQKLQDECKKKFPEGIKNGELAAIDGGKLKCSKVYLTALPEWKDANGGKILKDFMAECLKQSERNQRQSIMFNAMGTGGYLCYPKDVVAKLMYNAIIDFDARQPRTWLKEVTFCVYGQDKDTVRAFEEQEHSQQMAGSTEATALSQEFKKGDVTIKVVTEDLATQKVDAVLCSVSENMNLSSSGLCKSLLKHGGKSLQDECSSRHNNKLPAGQVVDIASGKLPCKVVLLANLPQYTKESTKETLLEILNSAFLKASTKGCKSIAIPAMGTGYLNYPATTVAKCMYDAVINWEATKPKTQLKTFKFILYNKNTEVVQAFRSCQKKMQGREERAGRSLEGEGPNQTADSKYQLQGNTCTIGPLKLDVCIGDVLGDKADVIVNGVSSNFELQGAIASALQNRCPNLSKEFRQKVNALKQHGVATTSGTGLACKNIVHVPFQSIQTDWTTKMVACLKEAESLKAKSVAFPVLGAGTGAKSFQPDVIAGCLFDAVDEYGGKNPKTCIKELRLVVYYQNSPDKVKIMAALQAKVSAGNNQSSARKFIRKMGDVLSDKMAQWGMMRHRGLRSIHEKRQVLADMSSVEVELVSDSYANMDRCLELLNDEIDKAYITKPVSVGDLAKSLSESQLEEMVDPNILVDVKIDKRGAKIIVSGTVKNVLAAQDAIHKRCRSYEKEKHTKIEADILYNQIRWHFEEITSTEVKEIEYGKNPNLKIETAYKGNKETVELKDTEGKVYIIDFKELVEYPKADKTDKVRVIRKDILKGARLTLPSKWVSMKDDEDFRVVYITPTTQEYKDIEKEFIHQVNTGQYASKIQNKQNIKVVKIERIQNRTLYEQYEAKKKNMSSQKHRKKPLERQVWHGTDAAPIISIERGGFNRSYCGAHGVWFGQGVYFAADASYSAQSYLTGSQPGQTANRYMFYVKALTGEFTKGNDKMRVLPPINPSGDKTIVYDSAVNDVNSPMEFVIFHDTQAYPEYLITYVG